VKRFDERDIMFSRVRLIEGTKRYEDYYKNHSELKDEDDRLRTRMLKKTAERLGITLEVIKKKLQRKTKLRKIINTVSKLSFGKIILKEKELSIIESQGKSDYDIIRNNIATPAMKTACLINSKAETSKVNHHRTNIDVKEATVIIKDLALSYGGDIVGITKLKNHHIYSNRGKGINYGDPINISYKYAIVVASALNKNMVNRSPKSEVISASMLGYAKSSTVTAQVALYIKSLGYDAVTDNFIKYNSAITPLAADAGIGQIGRCNMVVNQTHGNRLKIGALLTDLPLIEDEPIDFGLTEFCNKCMKCAKNCPTKAISFEKPKMFNGVLQWGHNENKCFDMWLNAESDCGICLSSCPFSQGVDGQLVGKMKNNCKVIEEILTIDNEKYGKRAFLKEGWPVI
jgi:ferredoxin